MGDQEAETTADRVAAGAERVDINSLASDAQILTGVFRKIVIQRLGIEPSFAMTQGEYLATLSHLGIDISIDDAHEVIKTFRSLDGPIVSPYTGECLYRPGHVMAVLADRGVSLAN